VDSISKDVAKDFMRQRDQTNDQHDDGAEDSDQEFQNLSKAGQLEIESRLCKPVNGNI
jgi:hypothetical protein